jgi:hypothetical protein
MLNSRSAAFSAALSAALLFTALAPAQTTEPAKKDPAAELEKQSRLVAAAQPALVIVEYTLQYDKGEAPRSGGYTGASRYSPDDGEESIKDERPLEIAGYLADATHVVTRDLQLHPRFIKSIAVRRYSPANDSKDRAAATIAAYPTRQNAVILSLDKPLSGPALPAFATDKAGPYSIISLGDDDARWHITVDSLGGPLIFTGDQRTFSAPAGLVVAEDGTPVTITTGAELPAGNAWKVAPLSWPATSAADMAALTGKLDKTAASTIVRATLNFRSPANNDPRQQMMMRGDEQNATVQEVLAVQVDPSTFLVLAKLKPTVTARLERIRLATEPPIDAKFKASLADYGAFLVTTDKPTAAPPLLASADIRDLKGAALPAAEILLQGEKRVATFDHRRIVGFRTGWRGNVYPQLVGEDKNTFLFTPEGSLLVLPVTRREKAATAERYSRDDAPLPTSAAQIADALKNLATATDPANVPLSEQQENRLAWVGVELQPLTQELARANNVSDQTSDGESGAVVTYVYPESPAAKAGVEPGWILLRVHAPNQPKPIDVHLENDLFGGEAFPWDRLGEAPESVFDRIPTPWSAVENTLIRAITDLGFGAKYSIEFFHDSKVDTKDFTVAEGPPHYASAPRFKSAPLGITVRDMTYEVRRYLQKKPEDPGVIVAKIEQGSKASVAGLKPYELITHVNDQPVNTVKDFEKLTAGQTDIRLSVKRMTAGRIVKIAVNAPAPTTKPAGPVLPSDPSVPPAP